MNANEFVAQYYGGLAGTVYKDPTPISPKDTVLILIDVQDELTRDYQYDHLKALGLDVDAMAPILDEMGAHIDSALKNIEKILKKCREKGIRPIHCKIQSMLPDASDTGRLHASAGMQQPPGSREATFLPEGMPLEGEIVLTKTCSGIHVGTNIDQILRNLGITHCIVAGFYTDQCVSSSVRDLADLNYKVTLIGDAVGAMSPGRHEKAMDAIYNFYARGETTENLLAQLDALG